MTNQPIHILNDMGVVAAFSVAKKITEDDIKKFFTKQKRNGKSEKQIENMLKEKILNDIKDAVMNNKIPGLIGSQDSAKEMGIEKIPELNRLIVIISHKLLEKKYDKMSLCYFINSLVNSLGLEESDFEKFHEENNQSDDEEDDNGFNKL